MKKGLVVKGCFLFLLTLTGGGCKEEVAEKWVEQVTDLTHEEEQVWALSYDRDGHVVKYGDIPVVYDGDQVVIGDANALEAKDKFYSVTFKMGKGKAQESLARCLLAWQDSLYAVEKRNTYAYKGDTIWIRTDYRTIPERTLLQQLHKKYVFDTDGRLLGLWATRTEAQDTLSAYRASFLYDKHIVCESNLNLQAYVMEQEGLDDFFYFLLNLGLTKNNLALPNEVAYVVAQEGRTYEMHAHYRMDNEHPIRIEVLHADARLRSRFDFSYASLH